MNPISILFLLAILATSCLREEYKPVWRGQGYPVSREIYEQDEAEFIECYMKNIEYYRLRLLGDSAKIYEDMYVSDNPLGPSCLTYAMLLSEKSKVTQGNIEVIVDTMLYSRDARFFFIFYAVKSKFDTMLDVEKSDKDRYDATAMIGYRDTINKCSKFYPMDDFQATGFYDYRKIMDNVEYYYLNTLKKRPAIGAIFPDSFSMNGWNVDDPDFFEKANYFQKYNDSTYYFQMKRYKTYPDTCFMKYNYAYGN